MAHWSRPPLTRRDALCRIGSGFGMMAFASLVARTASAADLVQKGKAAVASGGLHHPAKAKAVIFLFMNGGLSQVDSFDPKPALDKYHGQPLPGGMMATERKIEVGAVILAQGFEVYQAEQSAEYGWGRYANVVTALQFERLLSASGPTFGHVKRLSDGEPAKKIAFLQCVGSRDQKHDYCSSVCCM